MDAIRVEYPRYMEPVIVKFAEEVSLRVGADGGGRMAKNLERVRLETDVFVIGGGLAGCMAVIKAAESGADVTTLDKANSNRSGCAASDIDH